MTVVWCDPPAPVKTPWREILAPVLGRPGEWAMVRDYQSRDAAVDAVRSLRRAAAGKGTVRIPDGRWEFRQGRIPDSRLFGVWARWLGE